VGCFLVEEWPRAPPAQTGRVGVVWVAQFIARQAFLPLFHGERGNKVRKNGQKGGRISSSRKMSCFQQLDSLVLQK